jgi:hypothetical protein
VAASTTPPPGAVPPAFASLVDDAAVFPPREASLEDAVRDHREARRAPYADLVGPFVVDDRRLPGLLDLLVPTPDEPLPVTVVVTGGAGAVEPAVRRASGRSGTGGLSLRSVEVALRDLDDLTGNARRVVAAVRSVEDVAPTAAAYVEVPLTHVPDPTTSRDWLAALDEVAAADLRLKLRTGGLDGSAFPTAATLAAAVDAALDRELSFKCTAGLHHAVRHRANDTGFEHHGFLNLLLATAATWDGAAREEVTQLLEERDAETVAAAAQEGVALTSARRWFTAFGCCAVADPLGDLLALGLLQRAP